jgi:hypothetical protein
VDDVGAAWRGKKALAPGADAAAADVRQHRAPGDVSKKGAPGLPDDSDDGGRSARRSLPGAGETGSGHVPVIGLAKSLRIYRPGEKAPFCLFAKAPR